MVDLMDGLHNLSGTFQKNAATSMDMSRSDYYTHVGAQTAAGIISPYADPIDFSCRELSVVTTNDMFQITSKLGSGTFGSVYSATVRDHGEEGSTARTGFVVALKQLRKTSEIEDKERLREVSFFRNVPRHKSLVELYDMFIDDRTGDVVFALEHMQQTLNSYIQHTHKAGKRISSTSVASCTRDILSGLVHIHSHGFLHRDLKPENILVNRSGRGIVCKLADFGLAKPLGPGDRWTGYVATRWYRAPEQLLGMPSHGTGVDIWAAMLIVGEICNMRPLFPGEDTVHMLTLQLSALGDPVRGTLGGGSPDVMRQVQSLRNSGSLGQNRDPYWRGYTKVSEWIRYYSHDVFAPLLMSGLKWDASSRPSAVELLFSAERLLEEVQERSMSQMIATSGVINIATK